MRKLLTLLIAALLLAMPATAVAEGTDADAASALAADTSTNTTDNSTPPAGEVFTIDNAAKYEGMDKAYKSGYKPSSQNGVAKIVLPLTTAETIQGSKLDAKFDLGDPAASPFQFKNYDKTFKLQKHNTDKGEREAYLVSIDLPLADNRAQGNYPVTINVTATLADSTPVTQSFTVYVVIADGIDPNATPEPEAVPDSGGDTGGGGGGSGEEKPAPQPKVILSRYAVSPSPVLAGETFHVSATLQNTSENQALNNVKVSVAGATAELMPTGESTGEFYFQKIAAQESVPIEMDMVTARNIKPEPQKLILTIEYEGKDASSTAFKEEAEIVVPVKQPIRLEYDEPQIPTELNAGDTVSVSMNVMNMGIGTVHNVRLTLEAPGMIPDKTAFIGNIESGAAKSGDMYVFVGTKSMTGEDAGDEKYGPTSGIVTLAYEDEYGEEFSDTFEFSTMINPPVINTDTDPEEEEPPKDYGQWWISIIIAGGIIAAILVIRAILKKKRAQQEHYEDD